MLHLKEEESNEKYEKKDNIKLGENVIEEKHKETDGCCRKKRKRE